MIPTEEYVARHLVFALVGCTRALITALGMMTENQFRLSQGHAIAYTEDSFIKLCEENGLTHNQSVDSVLRA